MSTEHNDEAAARQLVDQVDELLREQQGLDAASRESLLADLQRALVSGGVVTAPVDPEQVLRDLAATLGELEQSGAIAADDQSGLLEAFERPLRDEGVQRAMEFARRCQADGEASARAWLASQSQATATASSPAASAVPAHLATAVRPRR